MNLIVAAAYTNSPAARPQSRSSCSSVGQSTSTSRKFREAAFEGLPYVAVDFAQLNLVENEHVRHFRQQRETEAFGDYVFDITTDETSLGVFFC